MHSSYNPLPYLLYSRSNWNIFSQPFVPPPNKIATERNYLVVEQDEKLNLPDLIFVLKVRSPMYFFYLAIVMVSNILLRPLLFWE